MPACIQALAEEAVMGLFLVSTLSWVSDLKFKVVGAQITLNDGVVFQFERVPPH